MQTDGDGGMEVQVGGPEAAENQGRNLGNSREKFNKNLKSRKFRKNSKISNISCFREKSNFYQPDASVVEFCVNFKAQNIDEVGEHCADVADGNAHQAVVDGTSTHPTTGEHLENRFGELFD